MGHIHARKIYNEETRFLINQFVNKFYTQFLFNIDAFSQYEMFPLDIEATFVNNTCPDIGKLFVTEGVKVPTRLP